jgi:hypothetical protein
MANWKHTLDVKDAWRQTKAGEMTIQAFAATAAEKIKALPVEDSELYDIADELMAIAADPAPDVKQFDTVWNQLYDWADQVVGGWNDKMCWIKTF